MTEQNGLDADVAVAGIGAMGSMTLWRLAERGVSVLGLEQFEPGHSRGSSYGESRIIRTAYFEDPRYVPLVRESFRLWRELEGVTDTSLLTMTGIIAIGTEDCEVIHGTLLSAGTHDLAYRMLDAEQMLRAYPQHRLHPGDIAVYEDPAGVLYPERAIFAAVDRAERLGARVLRNTSVEGIERRSGHTEVRTSAGTYRVRHVVVSVGPWLGTLLPQADLPVWVARQVLAWFPVPNPDEFRPDRFPVFLHDIGGHAYYGFPTLDGETVKLAIHHEGERTTAEGVDRKVHATDIEPLQEFIEHFLVGVEPRPARSHVCMYTNTPDFHFLVGSPPQMPWMTVLGGFSGHGFKFAPVIGEAAASLATDGSAGDAFRLFALERFAAVPPSAARGTHDV